MLCSFKISFQDIGNTCEIKKLLNRFTAMFAGFVKFYNSIIVEKIRNTGIVSDLGCKKNI